jgi:oligopeptide/dipeptide ABC transporter ATP-binding protein
MTETTATHGQSDVLVRVEGLKKYFPIRRGWRRQQVGAVQAVDGLDFEIYRGETLGLVGESGCGKSTTGRLLLQLLRPSAGRVIMDNRELTSLSAEELRASRRHMQMIFQDPYVSLNPRMTVGKSSRSRCGCTTWVWPRPRAASECRSCWRGWGLNPHYIHRYPHEFSGGQRQRIGIARALATNPGFIVADEPISALDVSIQAQVINLLDDLKQELGLTYLFIAHDLAVVRYLSDRVAVMYLGRIVELGERDDVFERPLHPYTQGLLSAIPIPDPIKEAKRERIILQGDVPNPARPPAGCRFHPRCPFATEICHTEDPALRNLGTAEKPHQVACHHAEVAASSVISARTRL